MTLLRGITPGVGLGEDFNEGGAFRRLCILSPVISAGENPKGHESDANAEYYLMKTILRFGMQKGLMVFAPCSSDTRAIPVRSSAGLLP